MAQGHAQPVPRRVSNDVGGLISQVRVPPFEYGVIVQVSWDGGPKEPVEGWCFAYTDDLKFVGVRFGDPRARQSSCFAWLPGEDVQHLLGGDPPADEGPV